MLGEKSVTLTVGRPADLVGLRLGVRRLLGGNGVDQAIVEEIVLATQEASKNALTFSEGPVGAAVTVCIACGDVVVEVADRGRGFEGDPQQVPVAGPLDEHGRGLFLMRRFMDTLEVMPRQVGTLVRMTRHLRSLDLTDASGA
jgi:anti-sigma regulatory factor (Ser/Thr protein kinase)